MKRGRPLKSKGLTIEDKIKIWRFKGKKTYRELGEMFNVSHVTIVRVMKSDPRNLIEKYAEPDK